MPRDGQMDAMADLAQEYAFDEIRISHEQNIILPHVALADLEALYRRSRFDPGLQRPMLASITDIIACPGLDYCALANARSIPLAQEISTRFGNPDRQAEIGELKIKISGCINACGHHHVGHIGLLGVEKKGAELYQITLGGSGDENTSIGEIIGRGFPSRKGHPDAIETIVNTYLGLRQDASEIFLDAYRRVGPQPSRTPLYGGNARGSRLRGEDKDMTKIWKETGFVTDDPWVVETEETKAGSNEKAILGIDAFLEKASSGDTGLGVLINPADDVTRLQPFLRAGVADCRGFPGVQRRPGVQSCLAAAGSPGLRQGNPRRRR